MKRLPLFAPVVALALLIAVQPARAYHDTPHGRALYCFGEAFALVEAVDLAVAHFDSMGATAMVPLMLEQEFLVGQVEVGVRIIHGRALSLADILRACIDDASTQATPDAAAALAAHAIGEELLTLEQSLARYRDSYSRNVGYIRDVLEEGFTTGDATNGEFERYVDFADRVAAAIPGIRTALATLADRSR